MRCVIGGQCYTTTIGSSIQTTRSVSDPVPTCTVSLVDATSSLTPLPFQEIIILDDQVIKNPTINLLLNPTMNPYTSNWTAGLGGTGITFSQNGGGGFTCTVANTNTLNEIILQQITTLAVIPGQTYCFSATLTGSSPVNLFGGLALWWTDGGGTRMSGITSGPQVTPGAAQRISLTGVAPAGAVYLGVGYMFYTNNLTNSGSITYTNAQAEPEWIATLSYPTPFCGPSQTNCTQLPLGYYIRQYRKFAGFVTHVVAQDYHGNVRTLVINAVGYAWIMGTIFANDTFSSKTDAQIITTLLGKYLLSSGTAMCTTTDVITGVTVSSLQCNWNDLRSIFDGLCGLSGYYWTIDYYWNSIYAPPGYFSQGISIILDPAPNPDNSSTFPGYGFSVEQDFTQPGTTVLVLGQGSNVVEVIDPNQTAQLAVNSGYNLPVGTSWMRKVNDSTLNSTTDCTTRGQQELLQYDYARNIYHVNTNQELIPGQSVQVTSATESLSASALLVQQTNARWIGTNETLTDEWEYKSDLGATNRAVINMISRIFRTTQTGTSAPAISTTSLAIIEKPINIAETITTAAVSSNYFTTAQADNPVALYMLGEITGTIADDTSGLAQQGTIGSGVTQRAIGLLTDAADSALTAMSFSSGSIALPSSGTWPTGHGTWTVEAWCKPTNNTNARNGHLVTIGNPGTTAAVAAIVQTSTGGWGVNTWGGAGHDFGGNGTSTAGTIYYVAATYDGSTNCDLYVGTGGSVTHYGPFNAGTLVLTTSANQAIGDAFASAIHNYFAGTIQAVGVYTTNLSSTRITAHYNAGI